MSNTLNFGRWMRRLGFDRSEEPEISYNAQPVIVVAEHKGLTPRYQGPSMISGGNSFGSAGEHSLMVWHCLSEGGMVCRELRMTTLGGVVFGFPLIGPTWGAIGPIALSTAVVEQGNPVSTGWVGTVTPANRQMVPSTVWPYQTGVPLNITTPFFVPPGSHFVVEGLSVNSAISGWGIFEEYPAAKGL